MKKLFLIPLFASLFGCAHINELEKENEELRHQAYVKRAENAILRFDLEKEQEYSGDICRLFIQERMSVILYNDGYDVVAANYVGNNKYEVYIADSQYLYGPYFMIFEDPEEKCKEAVELMKKER